MNKINSSNLNVKVGCDIVDVKRFNPMKKLKYKDKKPPIYDGRFFISLTFSSIKFVIAIYDILAMALSLKTIGSP